MRPEEIGVLVVEDEPRLRELLVRAIGQWGFVADGAHSGEEAVRLMEVRERQVVVMDLNLPGMGGIECLTAIRGRWPGTQEIVLTGFGDLEAARAAIHLEVVEFLTKPCHMGDLERALARAQERLSGGEKSVILPPAPPEPAAGEPMTMEEIERRHILSALARNGGNRAATAAELQISLRTLYYRLTEYQKQGYPVD